GMAMLTRSIDLEHRAGGIRVFGFQPGTTDTDMQVTIRASGINIISKIPREQLTPVAHPARAIVYLCTKDADDLAGKEFSLRDEDFRRRIALAGEAAGVCRSPRQRPQRGGGALDDGFPFAPVLLAEDAPFGLSRYVPRHAKPTP